MTKKIGEFSLGQSVRKLPEKERKVLFYKTYFEESNIDRKPLIWSKDKIKMKFGPKIMGEFGFRQSVQKLPENYGKV